MDPGTIERLREIIASIEKRSATIKTREDKEDTGPGGRAELGHRSRQLPSHSASAVACPSLPSPTMVTTTAPGVKLFTYNLAPGDYPDLEDRSDDEALNILVDFGLLSDVAVPVRRGGGSRAGVPGFSRP